MVSPDRRQYEPFGQSIGAIASLGITGVICLENPSVLVVGGLSGRGILVQAACLCYNKPLIIKQ